jgi:hypothetical protein
MMSLRVLALVPGLLVLLAAAPSYADPALQLILSCPEGLNDPDHPDSPNIQPPLRLDQMGGLTETRIADLNFIFGNLDRIAAAAGIPGQFDTERLAVAGHSFGSVIAMAKAGLCDVASLRPLSDLFEDADEVIALSARNAFESIKDHHMKDPVTARKFVEADVATSDDMTAIPFNAERIATQQLLDKVLSDLTSSDLVVKERGLTRALDHCKEEIGDVRWIAPLCGIMRNGSTSMFISRWTVLAESLVWTVEKTR